MKRLIQLILLGFLFITLSACTKDPVQKIRPNNQNYYSLFVRSFSDSNQDGIGDLKGVMNQLDYLKDLGITAIWLLPIHPSPTYHGYDVIDYYDINEAYGTMEDFKALVKAAKKKNIDIILDLVINHTSDQHPWYLDAKSSVDSEYRDYYIWDNNQAFESFVGGMKDLNLKNPKVVQEIFDIMDFYLEMGVKGFRLDAAKHFFLKPGETASRIKNTLFIGELNHFMKEKYEDTYLIAEVLDMQSDFYAEYYATVDGLFNFEVLSIIEDKVGYGNSRSNMVSSIKRTYDKFNKQSQTYFDAPLVSNHDMDRAASKAAYQTTMGAEKLRQATAIYLTLPGNPFVYYGDELGMKGYRYEGESIPEYGVVYDEYRRQPFIWGETEQLTTWLPSDQSNQHTKSLSEQEKDNTSMYHLYKTLLNLRKNTDALMYGRDFIPYKGNNANIQGYLRTYEDKHTKQAVLVIHNVSMDQRTLDIPYKKILFGSLTMEAYGTLILEIDFNLIGEYS